MRFFLILLLLLGNHAVFTQTAFIRQLNTSNEEIITCMKQLNNSYFISLTESFEAFGHTQSTKLIKLNEKGELMAELNIEVSDSSYYTVVDMLPINNSEFITIARSKQKQLPNAQIGILKIDTSLNIVWDKRYAINQPDLSNVFATQNNSNNVVIGISPCTGSPNWNFSLLFIEINNNGDSLQASQYFTAGNPHLTGIFSLCAINGQYKAFVNGYTAYTNNNCFSQILQIDSNLNLLEVRPVPYFIQEYMTAEKIDDTKYYLAGRAYSSPTHYDVGVAKLSSNEDSIAYNHAGKPGTTVDYSGWMKCMSISNSNSIYTGGTSNDNGQFYLCNTTYKTLMLSNYDSLLNCRWTRFYGSDTACYTLSTLEATSDGGCIVGGMFVTPSRPENMLDVVILKVDSLGLFTDLPENAFVRVYEAIVYPNPGLDYLVVQSGPQIAGTGFRLYDAAGCTVLECTLNSTNEQMGTSTLPPGVYHWQIIQKGKLIEKGKWVKY